MELSSHKIKTRVFLGEPLRIFHDCFLCVYIFSPLTFTTVFRVFSLLIACFNAANFLYHDCFFAAFLSGTLFLC